MVLGVGFQPGDVDVYRVAERGDRDGRSRGDDVGELGVGRDLPLDLDVGVGKRLGGEQAGPQDHRVGERVAGRHAERERIGRDDRDGRGVVVVAAVDVGADVDVGGVRRRGVGALRARWRRCRRRAVGVSPRRRCTPRAPPRSCRPGTHVASAVLRPRPRRPPVVLTAAPDRECAIGGANSRVEDVSARGGRGHIAWVSDVDAFRRRRRASSAGLPTSALLASDRRPWCG